MLSPSVYLAALIRDTATFSELLVDADLSVPVPACPGWTVGDLTRHLSGIHRWAHGVLVTGESGDEPEGPQDPDELRVWFADGASMLITALSETDPQAPMWTFGPKPRLAEFWFRRQALETFVHLWDLQQALGQPLAVDDDLARDGVDEVVCMFFPRQVRLGRIQPLTNSLSLHLSDVDVTYVICGDGIEPLDRQSDATVTGNAAELLMLLWGRLDVTEVSFIGDLEAARTVLRAGLTA